MREWGGYKSDFRGFYGAKIKEEGNGP